MHTVFKCLRFGGVVFVGRTLGRELLGPDFGPMKQFDGGCGCLCPVGGRLSHEKLHHIARLALSAVRMPFELMR